MKIEDYKGCEALGYVRLSQRDKRLKKDEIETSLINQKRIINEFGKDKGIKIVKIYEERYLSGSDNKRKELIEMKKEIVNNQNIKLIIIKHNDRLFRKVSKQLDFLEDLHAHGKYVYTIEDSKFIKHNDFIDIIKAGLSEEPINKARISYERKLQDKIQEGMPVGTAPYGYRNNRKTKKWDINIKQSKIVQRVQYHLNKRTKYQDICKELGIKKYQISRIKKGIETGIYQGYCYFKRPIKDSDGKIIRNVELKWKLKNHKSIL